MDNQIKPQVLQSKKIFAVVAGVLVLGAGVFAYTYLGNSNSADGSNPPGITIDYPKFKGEMNPNVICNIPKAYKFTSDADSKYKTGDAEAKDLQSGIHMYHSDTDIFVQDIIDRIDSVSGNVILIAYYPSSGNPSNLFSVFPELKGQNAISATAAKTYKIPANEGFTIFSCKASKIYGIKTETEFGSDLPAILKSKADSGWVLMAAKKPASGKDVKKEMKEVNDDNKSKNKPKLKSAWPQKGKGFSFSGSQQPEALAVDSTYKMVWVEMSTEDIKKDPTPELTLYATNGSEVSAKKGDTVVLDFIELMSLNKVANVKSIDFSNAGTDVLANLSGYKLFSSTKSDDGKTLKDAKEVTGCTIKPVSLKINVACTTGSLSINPASPLYLELRATIAQTAVLTKTFKLSIASLEDIKLYESGFKKTNYYASPAYTAGGKAAIALPIYWNTYTVSDAAVTGPLSVPNGLIFDNKTTIVSWDAATGPVDSYNLHIVFADYDKVQVTKVNSFKLSYNPKEKYTFTVQSCKADGKTCSEYSAPYIVPAAGAQANLVAPTKLMFDTDKKTLTWTDTSTGVTKYKVTIESVEYSSLTTSYKFDAYSNTKNYNFGVSACTDQTCSAMSEVLVVAPKSTGIVSKESLAAPKLAQPPSAPSNITIVPGTSDATIKWKQSAGDVSKEIGTYELDYAEGACPTMPASFPTPKTIKAVDVLTSNNLVDASYKLEGLSANTKYLFYLMASNDGGKNWSPILSSQGVDCHEFTTKAASAPAIVEDIPSLTVTTKVGQYDPSNLITFSYTIKGFVSPSETIVLDYGDGNSATLDNISVASGKSFAGVLSHEYKFSPTPYKYKMTIKKAATNEVIYETNTVPLTVDNPTPLYNTKNPTAKPSIVVTTSVLENPGADIVTFSYTVDGAVNTTDNHLVWDFDDGKGFYTHTKDSLLQPFTTPSGQTSRIYTDPGAYNVKVYLYSTIPIVTYSVPSFTLKSATVEVINLYDIINDSYGKCSDSSNGTCKAGETCIEIFGSQHICKTDANAYMYQCNAAYTCSGGPYVCWNNYKCAGQASCLDSNGKEVGKASGTGYVCNGTYKCTQGLSCDNASGSGCTGTKTCQ